MKKFLNILLTILAVAGLFFTLEESRNFVLAKATTLPPKLSSPCDYPTVVSLTPALEWESVSGAWGYEWEVWLRKNAQEYQKVFWGGSYVTQKEFPLQTTVIIPPNKLIPDNNYQWKVKSRDINNNLSDSWSTPCIFNTNSVAPAPTPTTPGGPTITGINPNSGSVGTLIKVTGENFSCDSYSTAQRTIIFTGNNNQTPATPACEELSTLVTTIPNFPSTVKSVDIQVKINDKISSPPTPFILTTPASTIPPPPAGPSAGSGASMKRSCEGKPLTIKNPSLYQATSTKDGWVTVAYDGLVPCGKCVVTKAGKVQDIKDQMKKDATNTLASAGQDVPYVSCQFCHFFIMFGGIVNFLLLKIAIPAAILLLVIGGAMFTFAAGNPGTIKKGGDIMKSVAIGLVIMFTAWIVVSTVLSLIGVASWTGLRNGWFGINCPINI